MRLSHRWYALLLAIVAFAARAQSDWLDEMPSVTTVAHAAFEELKVTDERNQIGMTRDDDSIAVNFVGTLTLLRQIMFLKYNEEPPMSKEREAKLKAIYAAYAEAELVVGLGAAGRRGYITRAQTGRGCRDIECYRRWFANDIMNVSGRAEYRRRILTRLFPCGDRAQELIELRQKHAINAPHMPSPAVTGEIEEEVAGIAPAGCSTFGGDANKNGLCDAWERTPEMPPMVVVTGAACGVLELNKVTTTDGDSVRVEYAMSPELARQPIKFKVYRSGQSTISDRARQIGEETVQVISPPASVGGKPIELEAVILKGTRELAINTDEPYVIVVAEIAGRSSTAYFQKRLIGIPIHGYTFRYWIEYPSLGGRIIAQANTPAFRDWLARWIGDRAVQFGTPGDVAPYFVDEVRKATDEALVTTSDFLDLSMREWLLDNPGVEEWQSAAVEVLQRWHCYDSLSFPYSWRYDSINDIASVLTSHGGRLYQQLRQLAIEVDRQHAGDVLDVHLIGHSRGAILAGQALQAWSREPPASRPAALQGSHVRVSLIDAHAANNTAVLVQEDVATDWTSLLSAVAYFEYRRFQGLTKDPPVVLPAGVGIRSVQAWYQHQTVSEIREVRGISDADNLFNFLNLWGQGGFIDNVSKYNRSGVDITWTQVRRTQSGDYVDHSTIVYHVLDKLYPADPLQPAGSPSAENCLRPPERG